MRDLKLLYTMTGLTKITGLGRKKLLKMFAKASITPVEIEGRRYYSILEMRAQLPRVFGLPVPQPPSAS